MSAWVVTGILGFIFGLAAGGYAAKLYYDR